MGNVLLVDVELDSLYVSRRIVYYSTYVAVDNVVVLGVLDDLLDLLDDTVNFGAGTANDDDVGVVR